MTRRRTALSVDEIAGWRRFLKSVARAARNPVSHGDGLAKAAARAGRLPLPPGQTTAESDLVVLIRLGKSFATRTPFERAEECERLKRLATAATAAVDAADALLFGQAHARLPYAET